MAAEASFEFLEDFVIQVMPALWPARSTMLQSQIFSIVFARQMRGEYSTVSDLALELDQPRSTVQNAADRLIDQERLESRSDDRDGRRRLLAVPNTMAGEVGALETILVRLLCHIHEVVTVIMTAPDSAEKRKQREQLREAVVKLGELLEGQNDRP